MRKLASVQRITAVDPIPGADAIEVCSVLGWKVVTSKGNFVPGDLGVYIEIDSKPPPVDHPAAHLFQFLRDKHSGTEESLRLRTIKLRGQVSQGLLIPLQELPDIADWYVEGQDLTQAMGITKWEPPLPQGGDQIGPFTSRISKTDEERLQGNPTLSDALWDRPYVITEKVDGASITMLRDEDGFHVYSRAWELGEGENAYWRGARSQDFEGFLKASFNRLAIQGELYGPGIQGNRLGASAVGVKVFNIIDLEDGHRLSFDEMHEIVEAFGLDLVHVVEFGSKFRYHLEELLHLAEGKYPGTQNEREGLVIRNNDDGEPVSFKVISQRFLLKGGE
jgi:RNA ligase (TIGR02306 family)